MPRVFRKAFRQRGQRVVRVDSSVLWVKVRPFLSLAFQPPHLLYGRAANYGSFIILSEGMIFSFQGTVSSFGLLSVWGVALAVTIVYLKTECFFRMHSFRFLYFFSPKKQQNRKLSFRFHIDTFYFLQQKRSRRTLSDFS